MTSPAPDTERTRAEEEAAAWLVALREQPDDAATRARFEAWRSACDLNAQIWARTGRAYDLIGHAPPGHPEHWARYAARRPAVLRPRRSPRRLAMRLAVGALAASLVLAIAPDVFVRLTADHATATAETRSIALDDRTTIRLGPQSAVDVAYTDGERRVRLIKGGAFFEVTPDPARPFRVAAGDTTVTVLGTAFDVRRGANATDVAVRHGLVRVEDPRATPPVAEQLKAGEWLHVASGGEASRGDLAPDEVAAWLRGELVARDWPIGDVVAELRRYYSGAIVIGDTAFAERRVSGIYDLRDPAATLRGLAAAHGATVRRISPWLLLITSG